MFSFLTVLLSALAIVNFIEDNDNTFAIALGAGISLISLILLFITKRYQFAGYTALILATLMTAYNMMLTSYFDHLVDFFWIISMSVYTFFVLGRYIGVIQVFANIIIIAVIFHLEQSGEIVRIPKEYTDLSEMNFWINLGISGFVFSYLCLQVIKALRYTETNFVEANMELIKSNEEKTMMLKEIHHRVKNNLQVITSMLRLQLHDMEDESTKHYFIDSINRVSAMATIHEKMYASESLAEIDLESYLDALISELISSYAVNLNIETHIQSNVKKIEPKSIVPIALIFNELVSNSIEHGFARKAQGKLEIKADQKQTGETVITYKDNGEWKAPSRENSLGVELITSFTEQLDGNCIQDHGPNGTSYTFTFDKLL